MWETLSISPHVSYRTTEETSEQEDTEPDADIPSAPVLSAKQGVNADLFPDILRLYLKPGDVIADVTFGKGRFWKNILPFKYALLATDLYMEMPDLRYDCRHLPWHDGSVDAVVLDPPYAVSHDNDLKESISRTYNINSGERRLRSVPEVVDFYDEALREAARVLRPGGVAIVKCQDQLENHRQYWVHIDVLKAAEAHGLVGEDLFVLVQNGRPVMRHKTQQHARKNHSYFWVFRKAGLDRGHL